jgi:hypothetical protein
MAIVESHGVYVNPDVIKNVPYSLLLKYFPHYFFLLIILPRQSFTIQV